MYRYLIEMEHEDGYRYREVVAVSCSKDIDNFIARYRAMGYGLSDLEEVKDGD